MKIILTNDDGIDAPGLAALHRACADRGRCVTIAPIREQSGIGHRLTTNEPILVDEVEPRRYSVGGTPVDCVRIAVRYLASDADWVIAGVNRGGNLGSDFYPSGTIAAAREAALLGVKSAAVSQYVHRGREIDWDSTSARVRRVLDELMGRPLPRGSYWNINLPHSETGRDETGRDDAAIVFCPLDPSPMEFRFVPSDRGLVYEGSYFDRPRLPRHDIDVCFSGDIAVTMLSMRDIGDSATADAAR